MYTCSGLKSYRQSDFINLFSKSATKRCEQCGSICKEIGLMFIISYPLRASSQSLNLSTMQDQVKQICQPEFVQSNCCFSQGCEAKLPEA